MQRSITLLSSGAEFVALLEAKKEIRFIVQGLLSIGIEVALLVIVCVDNIGAIFMAENVSTSPRTKHVDILYHFVWEFIEDGFIKIVFVQTGDNKADEFTKNVVGDLYDKHTNDMVWKAEEMDKSVKEWLTIGRVLEGIANIPSIPRGTKDRQRLFSVLGWLNG